MRKIVYLFTALTLSLTLILTSCRTVPPPAPTEAVSPQYDQHGIDQARLSLMNEVITELDLPIDSIVILRHGEKVYETYPNPAYGPDDPHLLFSVTKSVTSALIGIAIDQEYIKGVDQKVIDFFPDWEIQNLDERKKDLTIEDLLTMQCGFEWEGPDDALHSWGDALRSREPAKYVLNLPMANDPGTTWIYNGGCSHLLSTILTRATEVSTLQFAREQLFNPLGIEQVRWPRDPQGVYFGGQDIWLTPRDMAKFGQLFLNQGVWEGDQIISAAWVAESTRTHVTIWGGGYGYQWWTYPDRGIFYASGAFEQRIMVLPEQDLVVVFTVDPRAGDLSSGEWGDNPPTVDWLLGRFILPALDTYQNLTYDNFGFSLEVPQGVHAREIGKGWQGNASDESGMVQFHYGGSPFENLGLQWESVETTPDVELALDDFSTAIQTLGVSLNQQGKRFRMSVGEHEALYQAFEVEEGEHRYPGLIAAWHCEDNMRTYIFYYATTPLLAQQGDFEGTFQTLLDSFICH